MRLGRGTRALSEAGTRSRRGAVLLSLEQGADSRPVCGVVALLLTGGSLCRPGGHPLCSAQLRAPRLATSPSLPLVSQEGAQAEGSTGWGPRRLEAGVHRARPWPPRVGWLVTALGTSFPLSPAKRRAAIGHTPFLPSGVQWERGRSGSGGGASSAQREVGLGAPPAREHLGGHPGGGGAGPGFGERAGVLPAERQRQKREHGPCRAGARTPAASSEPREAERGSGLRTEPSPGAGHSRPHTADTN